MFKRSLLLFTLLLALNGSAFADPSTTNVDSNDSTANVIDRNNQMMMVFVQRLKSGNVAEARKIAKDMTAFSQKYKDSATVEYKSFYSNIEKEIYMLKNKDNKKKVVWVEEPIADGYYFLAVIDFQDKQYKDAIDNIQKCISWNPVRSAYYCERGFIFLNAGPDSDIISAQVAYEQALEYANDEESFAAALRGLGFVFALKNQFEESYAAMILSKEYEPDSIDADEHIIRLKNLIRGIDLNIDAKKARQILQKNHIQTTFSPEQVKVLVKLASELKMPEEKEKAKIFLTRALMLDPHNKEAINKLKEIQK